MGRTLRLDLLVDIVTAPYDFVNWLTDLVFVTIHDLFNRYGTPIVFLAAVLEATVGVGLVFPGILITFLGGAAAAEGELRIEAVFAAAIVGTALGDAVSYSLGRWGSGWLLRTRLGPSLRVGGEMMQGRARWFVPFTHLHNVTRSIGAFSAGLIRMPLAIWIPLDLLGIMMSSVAWVGAGYIFGRALLTEDGTLEEHPVIRIGLMVLGAALFLLMRSAYLGRLRAAREADDHEDAEAAGAVASGSDRDR